MMESLVARTTQELSAEFGETTPISWKPKHQLSYDEWETVGNTLQVINGAMNWWIGDWLAYGEFKYGESYAQALEVTDSSIESLRKYKAVSERVPISIRDENLSWTHHFYVAYLDESLRGPMLRIAADYELSSREFKQLTRRSIPDIIKITEAWSAEGALYYDLESLLAVVDGKPQYELSAPVDASESSAETTQIEDPDVESKPETEDEIPFTDFGDEQTEDYMDDYIAENDTTVVNKFVDYFAEFGVYIVETSKNYMEFNNGLSIEADLDENGEAILVWGIP